MNASKNSFLQMQEEDEMTFQVPPDIEENVIGSLQVLTMMGQAMELFIPKALEMFVLTMGGTIKEIDSVQNAENLSSGDPSEDTDDDAPGIGGIAPDDSLL